MTARRKWPERRQAGLAQKGSSWKPQLTTDFSSLEAALGCARECRPGVGGQGATTHSGSACKEEQHRQPAAGRRSWARHEIALKDDRFRCNLELPAFE
jgi:hypothetical protein